MARPGITFDDVRQAALGLVRDGETPSIQRLREALGRGSNTTIASHLRRWQSELARHQVAELPLAVPPQLLSAVEQFWLAALDQSEAVFQERRTALEQSAAQAAEERDTALARLEDTELQLAQSHQAHEALDGQHRELAQRLSRLTAEHESLKQLLENRASDWSRQAMDYQSRIDGLESALSQIQREARDDAEHRRRALDNERQTAIAREHALNATLDDTRTQLQACERRAAELEGRLTEQTPRMDALSLQLSETMKRLADETTARHQAEQRASVADERVAALRRELSWTRVQLESLG